MPCPYCDAFGRGLFGPAPTPRRAAAGSGPSGPPVCAADAQVVGHGAWSRREPAWPGDRDVRRGGAGPPCNRPPAGVGAPTAGRPPPGLARGAASPGAAPER